MNELSLSQPPAMSPRPIAVWAFCRRLVTLFIAGGSSERACTFDCRSVTCVAAPFTVTVKLLLPVLPVASVAEQLTVVVVMANVLPEAGVQVTIGFAGVVSVAVATKLSGVPAALVALMVHAVTGVVHVAPLGTVTVTLTAGGVVSTVQV